MVASYAFAEFLREHLVPLGRVTLPLNYENRLSERIAASLG
jgi:hypothetical protein